MPTKQQADMLRAICDSLPPGAETDTLRDIASAIEYELSDRAKRDTEYQALQDIGKSAAESIAEMVAALECDYDRLGELREERTDLAARYTLHKCDNGTFDVIDTERDEDVTGYDWHNIGTEGKETTAWTALYAQLLPDEAEELAELEKAAGECESREDAEQRIHEDPLSVEVRSGWYAPTANHLERQSPEEFYILLGTGGPATRIIGELNEHGEPTRARIQAQDWFKPWTDYTGDAISQDDLLTYCRCFYFGE
jgi:hypothetical protein